MSREENGPTIVDQSLEHSRLRHLDRGRQGKTPPHQGARQVQGRCHASRSCLLKPSTKHRNSAALMKSAKVVCWIWPTEGHLLGKHGGLILSPFLCTTRPSHNGHLILMANAVPVSHERKLRLKQLRGNFWSPGPGSMIQEGALKDLLATSSSSLLFTTYRHQPTPRGSFSLSGDKDLKVALPVQPTNTSSLPSWPLGLLLAFPYRPCLEELSPDREPPAGSTASGVYPRAPS